MKESRPGHKRPLHETYYYSVFFMVALSVVFISILAYLNESTSDAIAESGELKMQESVLYVFDIDYIETPQGIRTAFFQEVESENGVFISRRDGSVAHPFEGSGLWGEIKGLVSISKGGEMLLGVTFTEQSETPGLGGRIDELWYRDQFRGIPLLDKGGGYLYYRPEADGNVDSISGATSTSNAVLEIINASLKSILQAGGGGE